MNSSALSHTPRSNETFDRDETAAREHPVKESLRCPHCDRRLSKWAVPDSPFNEWPSEFQYVCFNDSCDYFVEGWATLAAQGAFGSYRFMYDPSTDGCHPVAVLSANAFREGIVDNER
jgi:hypothetical protein